MENSITSLAGFRRFLFNEKKITFSLIIALSVAIIQFTVFKTFFPFASFIHGDSFSYINAAQQNFIISTYPIGYSKFLRLFSVLTKSDTTLVYFQYIFVVGSVLLFCYSLIYLFKLSKTVLYILLAFFILNPLLLILGNLVSSDCMFVALSFLWLTTLVWICNTRNKSALFIHSLILLGCFSVRYNALIYPIISILSIFATGFSIKQKSLQSVQIVIPTLLFVFLTMYQYKKQTHIWQFSPFSGWQIANNAMYAIKFIDSLDRKPVSPKYQGIDSLVKSYFAIYGDTAKYPFEKELASTYYMWSPGMPLMEYKSRMFKGKQVPEFKQWASMGPIYSGYGLELVKQYPKEYFTNFIVPNTLKYYAPPTEFLEFYNQKHTTVDSSAIKWFGYKSKFVKAKAGTRYGNVLKIYPTLSGAINFMMLFAIIGILFIGGIKDKTNFRIIIFIGGMLWIINAAFTIVVSSAALRFQSFPILATAVFSVLYIDWIARKAFSKDTIETTNKLPAQQTLAIIQ